MVVYDDDTTVADEAAWALHEELTAAGVDVREVLRVHDDHWFAVLPGAPLAAYRGVPFALAEHRFTAQGVFDGRVTHAQPRGAARDPRPGRRPPRRPWRPPRSGAPHCRPGALAHAGAHATRPRQGRPSRRAELAAVAVSLTAGRPAATRRGRGWIAPTPGGPSTCGRTPYVACRRATSRGRRPCWRSPPGSSATARSPGARSTGAARSPRPTRSPGWSPSCSTRATLARLWEELRPRLGRSSRRTSTRRRETAHRAVPAEAGRD